MVEVSLSLLLLLLLGQVIHILATMRAGRGAVVQGRVVAAVAAARLASSPGAGRVGVGAAQQRGHAFAHPLGGLKERQASAAAGLHGRAVLPDDLRAALVGSGGGGVLLGLGLLGAGAALGVGASRRGRLRHSW